MWTQSLGRYDPVEEGMGIIPWTEQPDRYGLQVCEELDTTKMT